MSYKNVGTTYLCDSYWVIRMKIEWLNSLQEDYNHRNKDDLTLTIERDKIEDELRTRLIPIPPPFPHVEN